MFAALCGELVPNIWRGPDPEHDVYSLFHKRSLAMGWLDERAAMEGTDRLGNSTRGAAGLWSMNDAGLGHPLAANGARLTSWFQVEVGAVAADRPLPVQPFLRCAGDTTARIGTLNLEAVLLLLPVQGLDVSLRPPYALVPSMRTTHWFSDGDPRLRIRVEVSITSGQEPSIASIAQRLAEQVSHLDQEVFVCESYGVGQLPGHSPPFDDSFWNGPALPGMKLRGELAEWS